MKTFKTLTALLLIVISTVTFASGNENSVKEKIEFIPHSTSKSINIAYSAVKKGKIRISLFSGEWLLHHEVHEGNAFIQSYNLSQLPDGEYVFEIKTPGGKTERNIRVSSSEVHEIEHEIQ